MPRASGGANCHGNIWLLRRQTILIDTVFCRFWRNEPNFPALTSPRNLSSSLRLAAEIGNQCQRFTTTQSRCRRHRRRRISAAFALGQDAAAVNCAASRPQTSLRQSQAAFGAREAVAPCRSLIGGLCGHARRRDLRGRLFQPFSQLNWAHWVSANPLGGRDQDRHGSAETCWIPQRQADPYLLTAERALPGTSNIRPSWSYRKSTVRLGMARRGTDPLERGCWCLRQRERARMELSNNVRIKNGRFTVLLHSAKFDFKSGVYGSDDLVEVQAGDGDNRVCRSGCGGQPRSGADFRRVTSGQTVTPQANQQPAVDVKRGPVHDVAVSGVPKGGSPPWRPQRCFASSGAGATAAEQTSQLRRPFVAAIFPGTNLKGADLDRRRQATFYYEQGAQGGLFRQCRRHSGGCTKMTCFGHDRPDS